VIEEVVAPVLHANVPAELVDNTELPQLLFTRTIGVNGVDNGAEVPVPTELVQPSTVIVRLYEAALVTVIEEVVAPLLHVYPIDIPCELEVIDNIELPQLLVTVTVGADGIALGADVPVPDKLVHSLAVAVTL
jgi:hypothetical protein